MRFNASLSKKGVQMIYLTNPNLAFDVDDVLAPFAENICAIMNKVGDVATILDYQEYDFSKYHSIDHKTFYELIVTSDVYAKIPAYDGVIQALKSLCERGFNIHLITARDSRTNATKKTKNWVNENNIPASSLTVMGGRGNDSKAYYYNKIGVSILVDDALHNIFDAIENAPNVIPFLVTQPWNSDNEKVNTLIKEGRVIRINSVCDVVDMIELKSHTNK